jgi:hypothetical protein
MDRRNFLKIAGLTATASVLAPPDVEAQSELPRHQGYMNPVGFPLELSSDARGGIKGTEDGKVLIAAMGSDGRFALAEWNKSQYTTAEIVHDFGFPPPESHIIRPINETQIASVIDGKVSLWYKDETEVWVERSLYQIPESKRSLDLKVMQDSLVYKTDSSFGIVDRNSGKHIELVADQLIDQRLPVFGIIGLNIVGMQYIDRVTSEVFTKVWQKQEDDWVELPLPPVGSTYVGSEGNLMCMKESTTNVVHAYTFLNGMWVEKGKITMQNNDADEFPVGVAALPNGHVGFYTMWSQREPTIESFVTFQPRLYELNTVTGRVEAFSLEGKKTLRGDLPPELPNTGIAEIPGQLPVVRSQTGDIVRRYETIIPPKYTTSVYLPSIRG